LHPGFCSRDFPAIWAGFRRRNSAGSSRLGEFEIIVTGWRFQRGQSAVKNGLAASAALAAAWALSSGSAAAQGDGVHVLTKARPSEAASIAVYGSVWTNSRLPTFAYNAVTGRLTFRSSYALSLIAAKPFHTFDLAVPGTGYRLNGFTLEAEAQVMKHFGAQDHVEATVALVLRSGQFALPGGFEMNVAFGNGLSHSFADAALEIGRTGLPGVNTYRTQYHMSFEAAFSSPAHPNASVFFRLHHRSGIYGLISPRKSGANFVGGGVRWTFDR
jgi:hypothetical protein